jgi:hypothetical protein
MMSASNLASGYVALPGESGFAMYFNRVIFSGLFEFQEIKHHKGAIFSASEKGRDLLNGWNHGVLDTHVHSLP